MKISELAQDEIVFLWDIMKSEDYDKERESTYTHLGGLYKYFEFEGSYNFRKQYTFVPCELEGIIIGYRYSKILRGACP